MLFWTISGGGLLALGAVIVAFDLRSSRKLRDRLPNRGADYRAPGIGTDQAAHEAILREQTKQTQMNYYMPPP